MQKYLSGLALGLMLFSSYCAQAKDSPTQLDQNEAVKISTDAYVYGYPLVLMDLSKKAMAEPEGEISNINQFTHRRSFPTPADTDVVTPNADTLYSTAWLDLSKEPVIFQIPDMGDRYFLMPIVDAWSNVVESPGSRTTGSKAQTYALVGPFWKGELPEGIRVIKVPTNVAWIIGRFFTQGSEDFAAVNKLQDQLRLTPLSVWGTTSTSGMKAIEVSTATSVPPVDQISQMDAASFYARLNTLLMQNPPLPGDDKMIAQLAMIGLTAKKEFSFEGMEPQIRKALDEGSQSAMRIIEESAQKVPGAKIVNNWQFAIGLGAYGTDYLKRAAIAKVGLGANLDADAIYPLTRLDSENQPLSGAYKYVLHFDKGQLPPVIGFWSLSMYNGRQFFVENPINRYSIGSRDQLKFNQDGSLDIYIQADSPGADRESNWLPAPRDIFNLALRLYWPKPSVLEGTWKPSAVRRLN